MSGGKRAVVCIIAVLGVVLQVFLAPHVSVAGAAPNIIAVFTILIAITRFESFGAVLPFLMGLAFDLFSGGTLGAMALCLLVSSYAASRLLPSVGNDTAFVSLLVGPSPCSPSSCSTAS